MSKSEMFSSWFCMGESGQYCPLFYGFHHDEYNILEKMGLFTYAEKVQGSAGFGAQDCIAVKVDFGHGIIIDGWKTFFPPSWSQKEVLIEVCRASKNKLKLLDERNLKRKYLCQAPSGIFIDIVFDVQGTMVSFYPSGENFPGIDI